MNVFYEESGGLSVATILCAQVSSMHVQTLHGKHIKIKTNSVLLEFHEPGLSEFMKLAQDVAEKVDENLLWELSTPREFSFVELANDYFGHPATPIEAAGIVVRLHSAPMYFYKKGRGRYKAAPAEALKAAQAGIEKKKLLAATQDRYMQQLLKFELPQEYRPIIRELLYKPTRNAIEHKALSAACALANLSPIKLLEKCGGIASCHDYHIDRLLFERFPKGIQFSEIYSIDELASIKSANVQAFSIDDASTTEIDDAFSVETLASGDWRIGIHIAIPALGFSPGSKIDREALCRLSTIYFPGGKFTMLPPTILDKFSLEEKQSRPSLSMYLIVNQEFLIRSITTEINEIFVAENLEREELERQFDPKNSSRTGQAGRWHDQLKILSKFVSHLSRLRRQDESNETGRVEYAIDVNNQYVTIIPRHRGSPIDKIVSELMIFVNTEWGKKLAENKVAGIYRAQHEGKTKLTTAPSPHEGLGVSQYLWASSPLRRYVDLLNQWQLISLVKNQAPSFHKNSDSLLTVMRDFELAHSAYNDFQKTMERYWCLRWIQQENIYDIPATVLRENTILFDGLPLQARLPSLPANHLGEKLNVKISNIDLFDLSFDCQFNGFLDTETKSNACDSAAFVA